MRRTVEVPVLIVGGGPVGLLTALGLRHFGVECTVVEKHVSTLDFPKGRRVNTRTVEILRQWGLEAAVAEVSLPRAESLFAFEGETLLAADFQRWELPVDDVNPASPTRELICSQEQYEPVLRARAKDSGVDMRFSTEFVGFTQDEDGVSADVVADSGRVSVRARYLVAADGGQGRTRDALGIGRSGPGTFGHRLRVWSKPISEREWRNARAPSTGCGNRCRGRCSSRSTTRPDGCSWSRTSRTPNRANR